MEDVEEFNLEIIIGALMASFDQIESVHIFGSRRYNTRSFRSDVDLLLITSGYIKPSDLRDFTIKWCRALDLFIVDFGKATSVANESYIEAKTNDELIIKLNALKLWDKVGGKTQELINRRAEKLNKNVRHKFTSLPNSSADYYTIGALKDYFKTANEHGLPAMPYLGSSTEEASNFIVEVLRNIITSCNTVTGYGQAKSGWTNNIGSEYDFQNLFWITTKPWLLNLSREDVVLKYDGNEKKSDFNLFNNQVIIELKYIKNDVDKRAIVKTLGSLKDFYSQHPNVRVLIFGILVEKNVDLDDKKWEVDFSFLGNIPLVRTVIIRNK